MPRSRRPVRTSARCGTASLRRCVGRPDPVLVGAARAAACPRNQSLAGGHGLPSLVEGLMQLAPTQSRQAPPRGRIGKCRDGITSPNGPGRTNLLTCSIGRASVKGRVGRRQSVTAARSVRSLVAARSTRWGRASIFGVGSLGCFARSGMSVGISVGTLLVLTISRQVARLEVRRQERPVRAGVQVSTRS